MTSHELSRYLRQGHDVGLQRRRGVVCLSLAAAGAMGLIAAYQVGLIRRLPEPPGFDSGKVSGSDEAYSHVKTPDALLGLGSYAVTAILAAAGGRDRARHSPWLALAATGKVVVDAVAGLKLTWDEWARQKAFCFYCLIATVATLGMLPLVVPEAREAVRALGFGRGRSGPSGVARRAVEYPWSRFARRRGVRDLVSR
jgi:uncharacterized membrane protein